MGEREDMIVKVVTIICLGAILLASAIGLTIVAVLTDRDLFKAEVFTFGGTLLLAGLGGVTWASLKRRRHRWRIEREEE